MKSVFKILGLLLKYSALIMAVINILQAVKEQIEKNFPEVNEPDPAPVPTPQEVEEHGEEVEEEPKKRGLFGKK